MSQESRARDKRSLPASLERPKPKGGRPRLPDRNLLAGIAYGLKTGIPWDILTEELGFGSVLTCWRRTAGTP